MGKEMKTIDSLFNTRYILMDDSLHWKKRWERGKAEKTSAKKNCQSTEHRLANSYLFLVRFAKCLDNAFTVHFPLNADQAFLEVIATLRPWQLINIGENKNKTRKTLLLLFQVNVLNWTQLSI